jgi:16S rRNA (cytosine1402-N4)-methyltransferase
MSDPGSGAAPRHVSVMPAEALRYLDPQPGQVIVDATVGAGGHSALIAARLGAAGRLIGLDQDDAMLELARPRLAGLPVTLVHASFDRLPRVLADLGVAQVDAVLADLGICSDQLDDPERGLSFTRPGPLDMRLNTQEGETARDLIHRSNERDLADLIYRYGEERFSRRIARRIVESRKRQPIDTTEQLADLVRKCVPRGRGGIDPATRTFQALRIAVNDELKALERLLEDLPRVLRPGGAAVMISFHSLEDRLVKQAFRDKQTWDVMTRKPITASDEEVASNPRARSAKLRAARLRPVLDGGRASGPAS